MFSAPSVSPSEFLAPLSDATERARKYSYVKWTRNSAREGSSAEREDVSFAVSAVGCDVSRNFDLGDILVCSFSLRFERLLDQSCGS